MNCDQADKLLMDSLMGALEAENRQALDGHLATCERCREEATGVESLWQDLGDLQESGHEVPSDKLTRRFRLALADFETNLHEISQPGFRQWWAGLWTARPAWQAAFSAALLLMGVLLGAGMTSRESTRGEIDQLRAEMDTMSRAVTISLLRHQSASERLRAVSWSRVAGSDDRVLTALLDSARHDPNVNVRLAAVDTLAAHAETGPVRIGLIDNLGVEESPLVQLALLEAVAGEEGLRNGELRKLTEAGVVEESVLQHFTAQSESL
jgi:hypothetical protein